MKALVSTLALSFSPSLLLAGSWGSGGGTLLGDQINPWFISNQNDEKVSYCLEVDKENFSETDEEVLERYIRSAFKYWHDQLLGRNHETIRLKVNPRMFVKENCQKSTKLRFQFGTLGKEQEKELKEMGVDFERQVAISVRTDYDRRTLQGKGFIYVGDDKGNNRFKFEGQVNEPWSIEEPFNWKGFRLQSVLIHELGHVFGLRHFGPAGTLMNELFPQLAVMEASTEIQINPTFYPMTNRLGISCGERSELVSYLGIKEGLDYCLIFTLDLTNENDKVGRLVVSDEEGREIATAYFDKQEQREELLINAYLPKEQIIIDHGEWPFAAGPKAIEWQFSGTIVTQSNIERPIFLQTGVGYFQIGGVLDGRMIPDLLSSSGDKRWKVIRREN